MQSKRSSEKTIARGETPHTNPQRHDEHTFSLKNTLYETQSIQNIENNLKLEKK